MAKKFGLGRGLGSLIPDGLNDEKEIEPQVDDQESVIEVVEPIDISQQLNTQQKIEYVDPKKITTSHYQPRQLFEHTALEELVNSIKEFGIIEPLIVSPLKQGSYKLVAGERRLRAAKILDLKTVPVILRTVSEQQRLEISLIENLQRRDLTSIEEANAYKKLIEEFSLTQEELAKKLGKSRSKIANSLRLLNLPAEVQALLGNGRLSEGHAKVILELATPQEQIIMARRVAEQNMSVRDVEKKVAIRKGKTKSPAVLDEKLQILQDELRGIFKTKVYIKPKKQGGLIEIEYYSDEELNDLIDRLGV
jgi:ParB family chromosome partitioning protein